MAKVNVTNLGFNQLPHFSTHAIEAFAELAELLPAKLGLPADFELLLCDLLRDSVKFLLPDNGFLFADHDFRPAMFDLLNLPYPVCALEFTATPELYAANSGLAQSSKRIALCFDPRKLPSSQVARLSRLCGKSFLELAPERSLAVMAVYEAEGMWSAGVGVVLVDLEDDRPLPLRGEIPSELKVLSDKVGQRLQAKKTAHGLPATFVTFPVRARLVGQSPAEAVEALYIDTIDEMRTAYEFLAAINCSNVGTQEVPPPRLLNERRKRKGRELFDAYKILDLSSTPGGGEAGTGSHATPRTHLRRGHIRQLGERYGYKVLWINATVVNANSSAAAIATVYKVSP